MHRAHLLEKWCPPSRDARLMQFNQYHKYTVDEHSLLAVAKAEALAQDQVCSVRSIVKSSGKISCTSRSCFTISGKGRGGS